MPIINPFHSISKRPLFTTRHSMARKDDQLNNPTEPLRLVLIGKTGNGKSTAGNTILGEELCKPKRGMTSGTDKCEWQQVYRNGRKIQITDTPGVCDTHKSQTEVQQEIAKCLLTCTPGPHAILMVLRCDKRFTDEEYDAYQELKSLFGRELTKYMILVFNGMDELQQGGSKLEDELKIVPHKLRQVVGEANGRVIGFNNQLDWKRRREQGDQLLDVVDSLVASNNGGYFTNDMMGVVEEKVQEEMIGEQKSREDIKDEVIKEKNKNFFRVILNAITFGKGTKHLCTIL